MKTIYADKYRQIGLKIAYYRKLRGLTQEQLAEKLELSPAFIGHVEAPNVNKAVSLDTLFDVAAALDVPPYKFLQFDERRGQPPTVYHKARVVSANFTKFCALHRCGYGVFHKMVYDSYASSSSSSSGYRAAISHRPSSSCFAPVLYSK